MSPDEAYGCACLIADEVERQVRAALSLSHDDRVPGVHISSHAGQSAGEAMPLVVVTVFRVGTAAELHQLHTALALQRLRYSAETLSVVFA